MRPRTTLVTGILLIAASAAAAERSLIRDTGAIPAEPLQIGGEPQFLFDLYVVDNTWTLNQDQEGAVVRVFHQPKKHPDNPLITHGDPSNFWVVRDADTGLFRMYYQANRRVLDGEFLPDNYQETLPEDGKKPEGLKFHTLIGYAESTDGIRWKIPDLNFYPQPNLKPNNIIIGRGQGAQTASCAPVMLENIPEADRHGYKYVMLYRAKGGGGKDFDGIRLIGSHDGIHFDEDSGQRIAHVHSDHHNTVSYDPQRNQYVMVLRAKHIYRHGQEGMLNTGESRRQARMISPDLWTDWLASTQPQQILTPDELDAVGGYNRFYGMPTRYYAGIFWGFLFPFRGNDDMYTELTWSRDGTNFQRFPTRPRIMEYGPEKAWDSMILKVSPSWIEIGDQWYIYYQGWDGPHRTQLRNGGIGLATIRKEGLVSLHGPEKGGVVCTRTIVWPKGNLTINANAKAGEISVRVSDEHRKPIEGFDYADCEIFRGDSLKQEIRWKSRGLKDLAGRTIRLEFLLKNADLYTFRAAL